MPTINGTPGDDTLTGGTPDDVLNGYGGHDVLAGGDGDDNLDGGEGADTLTGGAGADSLNGGAGNDVIHAAAGDVVAGGDGDDTLVTAGVLTIAYDPADASSGTMTFIDSSTLTFSSMESMLFTAGRDGVVDGTAGDDEIGFGYADTDGDRQDGNDALLPGEAGDDDIIAAGDGNDTVYGGGGNDAVTGEDGADRLQGDFGDDSLDGGTGDDSLFGGTENDTLTGGDGADLMDAGTGDDAIFGGTGADNIFASDGNDTVEGGTGADTLRGDAGADRLSGGDDADAIHAGGGDVADGGEGGDDNDTLHANNVLTVSLDPGNPEGGTITFIDSSTLTFSNMEQFVLNGGRDGIIYGTAEDDLIGAGYMDANGDRVDGGDAVFAGSGPDDDGISAGAGDDTIQSGEGRDDAYGGDDNDTLNLGAGNDYAQGDAGSDTVNGEDGDDFIRGDAGNDQVFGGVGDDQVFGGADQDSVFGGLGNDSVFGGLGQDTVFGGDGQDTMFGMFGDDAIYGGDGDDRLSGNIGNDTFYGGAGADDLNGEDDADTFFADQDDFVAGGDGGDDNDTLYVYDVASVFRDPANIENGTVTFNNGETLSFLGIENIYADDVLLPRPDGVVEGTGGADTIDVTYVGDPDGDRIDNSDAVDPAAGPQDDRVEAGAGDDTVQAGAGADTILGETGVDVLFGDTGNDSLFGGTELDVLYGGTGNDTLFGGEGTDKLIGEDDRDVLHGSVGDTVDGGEGGDDFDVLDLRGNGRFDILPDAADAEAGTVNFLDSDGNITGSLTYRNIESIVPCFTPGSLILTDRGEVAVERLEAGDRVLTRDNGYQVVRWAGSRALSRAELLAEPRMNPVLIRAGALGDALPERDMMVSPQHRMLMTGPRAEMFFGAHEVLVAAIHLVGVEGVERVAPHEVTYVHLMFDRHEIIRADGSWSESFQPGLLTLNGIGEAQRAEILSLFPELGQPAGIAAYAAARLSLKRHEAALLFA